MKAIFNRNLLIDIAKKSGLIVNENEWWHSDIKNIAFRFNNKFFKKLVDEEEE